jgi:hypothetical protein
MQEIIEQHQVAPEDLEVLNVYLQTTDLDMTVKETGLPKDQVIAIINKREVKQVIDTVFLEQGYMNRFRLKDVLGEIIESKLEEAREAEEYTSKDLVDVIALMHKIGQDERKLQVDRDKINKPTNQTNVQINDYGQNYGSLLERILQGEK